MNLRPNKVMTRIVALTSGDNKIETAAAIVVAVGVQETNNSIASQFKVFLIKGAD